MMKKAVIYIHGKGGTAGEAEHYQPLFGEYDVSGMDYKSETPWEAKEEFPILFDKLCGGRESVILIANSIGAFFAMHALQARNIEKAFFISPIVDMETLIADMLVWAGTTEEALFKKKEIRTGFGETLSWEYLSYVRENPIVWKVPTAILYGEGDHLTSRDTITAFADKIGASVTVMKNGVHWFHTEEQMEFLDDWFRRMQHEGQSGKSAAPGRKI